MVRKMEIHLRLLREEVYRKGVVYAWTPTFLTNLVTLSHSDRRITVETFAAPKPIEGLATPPIGVARLRP